MATALGSPEKQSFLLVTFRYGDPADPDFSRYTDWGRDFETFSSTPSLEVELGENNGSLETDETRIVTAVDAFTGAAGDTLPFSPIFVQIEEVSAGMFAGDAGSRFTIFNGRVVRSIKNYQGRNDTVTFFAKPAKARLDAPLGIQCNHHCAWALFSRGCGLTQSTHDKLGQIASMDGKEITISANASITAPVAPGGDNTRFWERGYLEKDGLKIDIHIWSISDPTVFVLRRRPPDSWLLAGASSILFVPGCHKTIEDCRGVWDNEEGQAGEGGFGGFGFAMLSYNPIIENPQ